MTDETVLRAARIIERRILGRTATTGARRAAQALADAGVFATSLPMPEDGCACTELAQNAGGIYTEYLLEYEPACPEHSDHLWNPRQGVWEVAAERDAELKAGALRMAANALYDDDLCDFILDLANDLEQYAEDVRADERERMLADVHNIARATTLTGTDVRTIINAIRETAAIRLAEHARLDPEEPTP